MSESTSSAADGAGTEAASARTTTSTPAASTPPSALASSGGTTTIAEGVVSKIAGLAARDVAGVHAVGGGGAARALSSLRERIPGGTTNFSQGVRVEVGAEEAAVDLEIVAEYGVPIADVAHQVRRSVVSAIERMTGLRVIEVNIAVGDVHLPEDDASSPDGAEAGPRVR
ncbi:Asp23/Gls24 family envelope stress response protein [Litorihabitans aurantiacus]|uniref:Stress protein n=1 Tax=Litorihabitans aurantiacus TaxID=1930061 RepID=A0AA37XF16_9MICO|nr:Asp23/Gls24 family envelope stress response protein [Litorihabitans aurantiacus]GMA31996.1 stress protein [Litorihabitans aurantiacus]